MAMGAAWARGPGWVLWLALAVTWFATLQVRPLLDPDEGRYAEIPREMLATGDWMTPRLDGLKYFEKPPLQYWATAAAYSAFGVSAWTARVWTVGLAFLCLPMVYGWVSRQYGQREGLAALGALASSPYFVLLGHLNMLDAGFTLWLSGALFAFAIAQSEPTGTASERRWMLAAWVAAALAVLTKGIVVGVLAGLSLIVYSILERDVRPWRRLHALIGVPLFLAITAPWFVVVTQRNPEFPYFFFVHEHFARFLTTVHQRVEPWWYFLPLLLIGVLPWIRAAAGAVRSAWFDPGVAAQFKPRRFLLIFAAVTLIFFSISGSKLAPYILPMMPALAALVGVHVVQTPRLMRTAGWTVVGLLGLVAVGLVVYGTMRNGFMPDETLLWAGGAVAIAALMAVVLWGRAANLTLGPVMSVCVASVLGWQCLLAGYTAMPPVRSAREIANFAGAEIGPQTTLYSVGQYRPTLSVYLRRTLILVGFQGELEFGLQQEPDRQNASPDEFLVRWRRSADAVAFFAPQVYRNYRQLGLPGRVIVSDGTTVVVSRNESGGGEKVPPPS